MNELFPVSYRDTLTRRWVKARYKATAEEIAATLAEWEIIGPAEIRSPISGVFNPYPVVPNAEVKRLDEPTPQINPHLDRPPSIDAGECFLTALFLRGYVTYCARRRRYVRMRGAARLHREVTTALDSLTTSRA